MTLTKPAEITNLSDCDLFKKTDRLLRQAQHKSRLNC